MDGTIRTLLLLGLALLVSEAHPVSLKAKTSIRSLPALVRTLTKGYGASREKMRSNAGLGFLRIEDGPESLLNDIREGETIEVDELRQPSSWDEYKAFVAETGGPSVAEENANEQLFETAPVETSYGLNVLWLEKNIAIAVDEIYPGNKRIPLTTFHLWPQTDAWEDIKSLLEKKSWISERDTINVLNQATEAINYWQEQHSAADARGNFPEMIVRGTEQAEGTSMDAENILSEMSEDSETQKVDTSAIPRITLKQAAGFEDLLPNMPWYRDPEAEGPWDKDAGVWKDVSIKSIEELHASVPQKMPGQK
mmetsp:Transcript_17558/g.42854  ORF Transcript_17558/g.42854 Transcript_17558/m.42854 type:complete len:309 (-) Transcript_17558:283-1209(-)|eukprot:CAMPEP_0114500288 /NCGR_PEP_ID=MMETSP0109-20121206/7881_1 /TAXON_ID=29199 /ORGANISM="Chlorarachnion reptans, Strain CCCM449" /LENGTH=308 /DNA_ID=CAMNT_0001677933 /DNA_START=93 /DNA_END=1019 /DNA_ORIENTATION=+